MFFVYNIQKIVRRKYIYIYLIIYIFVTIKYWSFHFYSLTYIYINIFVKIYEKFIQILFRKQIILHLENQWL